LLFKIQYTRWITPKRVAKKRTSAHSAKATQLFRCESGCEPFTTPRFDLQTFCTRGMRVNRSANEARKLKINITQGVVTLNKKKLFYTRFV